MKYETWEHPFKCHRCMDYHYKSTETAIKANPNRDADWWCEWWGKFDERMTAFSKRCAE